MRVVILQEINERKKSLRISKKYPESLYAKNLIRFRRKEVRRKKRQAPGIKSFSESIEAIPHRLKCLFNHHLSALVYRPYEWRNSNDNGCCINCTLFKLMTESYLSARMLRQ